MNSPKIRLIHNRLSTEAAKRARDEWGLENARQLGLFDDFGKLTVVLLPMADINAHLFLRALERFAPTLLLDTRRFPDFYSLFTSTDEALEEFHGRQIEYVRLPFSSPSQSDEVWQQLSAIKTVIKQHLSKPTSAPLFILLSTKTSLERVGSRLKGYISQEIADTRFLEIGGSSVSSSS